MQRLLDRHQQIRLDVPAPRRLRRRATHPAKRIRLPPPRRAAEKLLKEIAKPRPLKPTRHPAPAPRLPRTPPARRRALRPALLPVRAQLIVAFPLFRIAQHLIGLIDLLKLRLRRLFILRHVRVMLPRKLPESLPHLILRGCLCNSKCGVIILVLNGHKLLPRECSHPPPARQPWFSGIENAASAASFSAAKTASSPRSGSGSKRPPWRSSRRRWRG